MRDYFLSILAIMLFATGCNTPTAIPHAVPAQVERSWDSVLANPRPIHWRPIRTGTFRVPDKVHFLDGPEEIVAAYEQSDDALPVYAHVIEHDAFGLHLVDAGFGADPDRRLGSVMARLLANAGRSFDVPPGQELASRLGAARGDVRSVFVTHLHFDHISGVTDLPEEVPVIVGPYSPSMQTRVAMGHYLEGRRIEALDFTAGHVMEPLGRALDVFGDQSLWAIETRGHTRGHVSFLVNGSEPVLLTGDVVHFRWGFDNDVPSISVGGDPVAQRENLTRLRAFAKRHPDVRIVFGHELPAAAP